MAARNPFYNPNAEAIERSVANLGTALFGDPQKANEFAVNKAQARRYNAEAGLDEDTLAARQTYADTLRRAYTPEGTFDRTLFDQSFPDILANSARGFEDPDVLMRAFAAFQPDADLRRSGTIAAGGIPTLNSAFTFDEGSRISARDAAEAQALQASAPRSIDQTLGAVIAGLPFEEQQDLARVKAFGSVTPRNIITAAGESGYAVGPYMRTGEGFDLAPAGSRFVGAEQIGDTAAAALGLTKPVQTDMQTYILKRQKAANIGRGVLEQISPQTQGLIPSLLDTPYAGMVRQIAPEVIDEITGDLGYNIPETQAGRNSMYRGVQQVREALMNEDGKLSDRDQVLVDQLGAISRMEVDAPTASTIWEKAISDWEAEVDYGFDTLEQGGLIRNPGTQRSPTPEAIEYLKANPDQVDPSVTQRNPFDQFDGGLTATSRFVAPRYRQAAEDAALDQMTNQALIEQQIGGPVNTQDDLDDFWLRSDLATMELPEEKQLRLEDAGYETTLAETPAGALPLFRSPGEKAYRRIDRPGMTVEDLGDVVGSLMNFENLVSTGATVLAPESLLLRMGVSGLGAAGGNIIDELIESARGYQRNTPAQQTAQAARAGGTTAGGEMLGALLNRMRGAVTGESGLFRSAPEVAEARKIASEDPNLLPPTMGQSGQFFQRLENRVAQTGDKIPQYRQKQKAGLQESLKKLVAGEESELDDETLMMLNAQLEKDLLDRYSMTQSAQGGKNIEAGGKALQEARSNYQKAQDAYFRKQYPELWAQRPEGTYFDISEVKDFASNILAGKPVPLESGEIGTLDAPISNQMRSRLEKMVGKEAVPASEGVEAIEAIPGYADQIDDPELLQEIANLFRDFAEPDPMTGKRTQEGGLAAQIQKRINESRFTPQGFDENAAEEFGSQWKNLSGEYKKYLDTLDLSAMRELETTENSYGSFIKMVQPGDPTRLRLLQEISSPQQFQKVKEGFEDYLASDPAKINAVLDGYKRDQASLRLLMTPEQEKSYRIFGNAVERLGDGPAKKYLTTQGDLGSRTLGILEKSTDEQFDDYLSAMMKLNPKKTDQIKSAMLRGVVQKVLDKHSRITGGQPDFNLNGFANEMDKLIRSGRLKKIANPGQLKALKDRTLLASVYGKTGRADVGASMGGSADVKDVLQAPGTGTSGRGRFTEAYQIFWDNSIMAPALISPKVQRVLVGSGKPENLKGKKITRNLAMALAIVGDDISAASDLNINLDEKPGAKKAQKALDKKTERNMKEQLK